MSSELALELVLCGALLVTLSLLARHLQPDFPLPTVFVGLAGGGLCVLWGVLGGCGRRSRFGAMVTLAAVACLLGWQVVQSWGTAGQSPANVRIVAVLLTVLVVVSIGTCVNLMREPKSPRS